jgi:hypothetical protein
VVVASRMKLTPLTLKVWVSALTKVAAVTVKLSLPAVGAA